LAADLPAKRRENGKYKQKPLKTGVLAYGEAAPSVLLAAAVTHGDCLAGVQKRAYIAPSSAKRCLKIWHCANKKRNETSISKREVKYERCR
jgi:hypothetical protein